MRPRSWNFSLTAALVLLCPFELVASLGMDLYLPAVPALPQRLGASPGAVQLTLAGYLAFLGAGQLVFGPLSDRVGRRPVLLGGALAFVASSFALAFAGSFAPFLALRIVQAGGGAAMLVATFATVRDVYAERPEGTRIYGLMSGVLVLVPAFGPLLGAGLLELGGLALVLAALGVLAAVAGARAFLVWPETRPEGGRNVRLVDAGAILRDPSFRTYTLAYGVAMGAFFVYLSIAPGILVGHFGCSPLGFGLLFGTVALVLVAVARKTGRIVARHGREGCLGRGLVIIAVGALGLLVPVDHVVAFLAPMWIVAAGIALVVAVAANGALAPFPDIAGTATALFQCLGTLFFVVAGTTAVLLLHGTHALVVFVVVGVALVAASKP